MKDTSDEHARGRFRKKFRKEVSKQLLRNRSSLVSAGKKILCVHLMQHWPFNLAVPPETHLHLTVQARHEVRCQEKKWFRTEHGKTLKKCIKPFDKGITVPEE